MEASRARLDEVIEIYEYLDYRGYLKDYYEARKKENDAYSYRFVGAKVGLDPGYVLRVMRGKYHLSEKSISAFEKLCKLTGRQAEYFRTLVHFGKCKSEDQKRFYLEKLIHLRSTGSRKVEAAQYEFYQKWYYAAVRSLIGFYPFKDDYQALAEKLSPPITVPEARSAVALLERLNFIRKGPGGFYEITDTLITTGKDWRSHAVKAFQAETMRLAGESLARHGKDRRDISTATVAVAAKDLDAFRERIREFRESVLNLAARSPEADTVYQFNVQWFPLSGPDGNDA